MHLIIKSLFILSMFSSLHVEAQQKRIAVDYSVNVVEDELMNSVDNFKRMQTEVIKKAKNYSFTLLINNEGSKFYNNPILNSETGVFSDKAIFIFLKYSGHTYNFKDTVLIKSSKMGPNTYIKKNRMSNWNLTKETKLVDKYKCYKATNTNTVISPDKVFNFPITAWYCPDLPYSYGPNGYGGLPGLILELQVRNGIYGLQKIDLDSKINFSQKELLNIKTLTQKESDSILESQYRKE
jgi:GLPGLI family protein